MAKKVSTDYLFDTDLIDAIRDCWDRGIYFYPVVAEDKALMPKVKIQFKQGRNIRTGDVLYNQGDELYEKIRELYLHKYAQVNKKA